jgi:hypothetical protein
MRIAPITAPFIAHTTDMLGFIQKVKGNFIRRGSFLGKKFDGIGQVLRARRQLPRLWTLARWFPEPFVLWLTIGTAPLLGLFTGGIWSIFVLTAGFSFVVWRKSLRTIVPYLGYLPQAIAGFRNFDESWTPRIAQVLTREEAVMTETPHTALGCAYQQSH